MVKKVILVVGETVNCGKAKVIGEIATDKSIQLRVLVTNCILP